MKEARKYSRARPSRDHDYQTTLGIDWGSQGVRARALHKMDDGQIVDKVIRASSDTLTFPVAVTRQRTSMIYPFDHASLNPPATAVYPGNQHLGDRRSISSKLAIYGVVGVSDEIARQSSELEALSSLIQCCPQVKGHIRIGIEQMLVCVLRDVHDYTQSPDFPGGDFDAIALTIPAQWTIDFQEEYGERFTAAWERVFDRAPPQLIFLSEGQANAHYAFWRGTPTAVTDRQKLPFFQYNLFSIGRTNNAVLIIDAGGHSTNTSLVNICDDGNQLEIRPDRGAIGGTSLWAMRMLHEIRLEYLRSGPLGRDDLSAEMENQALRLFYARIEEYSDNCRVFFTLGDDDRDGAHCIVLGPSKLVETFEHVHAPAFALIEDGIRELKGLESSCEKLEIVIGGGSARGKMWVTRVLQLCARYEMKQPVFLSQIDPVYEHTRVAAGANYALAEAKGVAAFAGRAGFGLAVKRRFKGENGWVNDWHHEAQVIWAQGHKFTKVFKANGAQELKVICQAQFDGPPQADSVIKYNYKTYDFFPITCRKSGSLKFDLEIDVSHDKLELTIMRKPAKSTRWSLIGKVEFNLWVAPGSRCLEFWEPAEDVQAMVAAAFSPDQRPAGINDFDDNGGASGNAAALDDELPDAPDPEDVVMGGMEGAEDFADSTTAAPAPGGEASRNPYGEGSSRGSSRPRRRGSTVPTGMFAQ